MFTDLAIDLAGAYRLSFLPLELDAAHPDAPAWLAARAFANETVDVDVSLAHLLVPAGPDAPDAVKTVDAGGNDVATDGAPRPNWTRRVPRPALIGHAASLAPY